MKSSVAMVIAAAGLTLLAGTAPANALERGVTADG